MSEIRTNLTISGEVSEYRSNMQISVVTLDSNLVDTQSSFRTNLNIVSSLNGEITGNINTILKLENTALDFYLVDMTKLNQSVLYFSKFFNMNFEPEVMWEFLTKGTNEQINISHLSDALSLYSTKKDLININTNINNLQSSLNKHILDNNIHLTKDEKSFLYEIMNKPPWSTGGNGRSGLFEYINVGDNNNIIWAARPIKYENKDVGIVSNTFISCRGLDITANGGGEGGITRSELFTILSSEPLNNQEYISESFLKLDSLKNWISNTFISKETDPTVPDYVKSITKNQILSWDKVASLFSVSEDDTYVFLTGNRGFVSNSFISCRGVDATSINTGSIDMDLVWFYLQSNSNEQIHISHLRDALLNYATTDWVNAQGYLKSFTETDPTVPIHVKKITTDQIFNWDLVASLFGLSQDDSYVYTTNNRGFVSNSFISCKGLDTTAYSASSGIDMSLVWYYLGQDTNEQINKSHLTEALQGYVDEEWINNKGYISSFTEKDPTVPNWVKTITSSQIENWDLYSTLFSISSDNKHIFINDGRGLVSESYISCKGLDASSPSISGGITREDLFSILSSIPEEGESINTDYLDLSNYVNVQWLESQGYLKKDDILEENASGNIVIKKSLLQTYTPSKGITIDKTKLTISMKVNNSTFGFNDNDELELLVIDGGLIN